VRQKTESFFAIIYILALAHFRRFKIVSLKMFGLNSWASKGVFPEGTTRGFYHSFSKGESGEICFSHWKSRKQPFFAEIFKIQGGLGPPSKNSYSSSYFKVMTI